MSLLLLALLQGPVPYPTSPSWQSYSSGVTTGGAFADINQDGWLDFVVANGNDILRQRVEVYLNDGAGGYSVNPQWQSSDVDYHGQLAIGDVDGDGWEDVAVSVFLGPAGFSQKGRVKLYRNLGGALEASPSWSSADRFYTFSCALGDADGDGDLDLAVATGEPYSGAPDQNRIYTNVNGTLQTSPSWLSSQFDHTMDCAFTDADNDGDLDLAFCTAKGPNRMHFQGPGGIDPVAGWTSTDNNSQNGNTLCFGDVDGDGDSDLAVSDNNQLTGGQGRFKIYRNSGATFDTAPFWSVFGGMVSAVAFADLHRDGRPDLAGGIWFAGSRIYLNNAGAFSAAHDWRSVSNSTVEAFDFGDTRNLAVRTRLSESLPANGARKGFRLSHAPVHELLELRADGAPLAPDAYSWDRASGWLSLAAPPLATLEADYRWSESLDLGVTNWDQSIGNQIFRRNPLVDVEAVPTGSIALHPGDSLKFRVDLQSSTNRQEFFDLWIVGRLPNGQYRILARQPRTLPPFGSLSIPFTIPIPPQIPPPLLGTFELHAGVLEAGNRLDEDVFSFTVS
jgi:hypothetical protein